MRSLEKTAGITFITLLIILIPLMVILNRGCSRAMDQLEKASEEYSSYLGKRTVIDGDTLTITSYKLFKESFTLSNGTEVHYEVAKKFLIEE